MLQKSDIICSFIDAKALMAERIRHYKPWNKIDRVEIKIKPIDQLGWLSAQKVDVKIFGADQEDSAAIAGVGQAFCLRGNARVDYARIFRQLRRYLTPQYPYLQWYGGFCFDAGAQDARWERFGCWHFILPRFELARDRDKMIFCCNLTGLVDKKQILKELARLKEPDRMKRLDLKVLSRRDAPRPKQWRKGVEAVLQNINARNCQKVVLARKTEFFFKEKLDPWDVLRNLKRVTANSYHFAFGFGDVVFLGASPERLYKRQGRNILTQALAGTKPGPTSPVLLLNSTKDRHEHKIVVDAITAGLKPLCRQLAFDLKPQIRTLSNGHHLNTQFQGHLKNSVKDENILVSLHPTPALGGEPRDFALKTIRRIEPFSRGWYAGPLGYVGPDRAEFVVGIRSALVKGRKLSVFAGAGIVAGSNAEDEWQEIENKISNFIKIIK